MLDQHHMYYDPWNVEIDLDPYPTYARLRSEAPVYYNEKVDFWALSRFDDVEVALHDVEHLSSAKTSAAARPMPVPPPEMTTTRPSIENLSFMPGAPFVGPIRSYAYTTV